MDTPGAYRGGVYTQHISRREIENMKKNMKKVPVIQLKTEIYHKKEAHEADKILYNIYQEDNHQISDIQIKKIQMPWYKKVLHIISRYFTPSL
ncbi:MAG TPA: hypothetical protein PKC87_00445 [Candidatus Absconditabacterales bacterium]|nr:hypothetical protein [Candidatus Absconditabacterales bacterium]